MLINDYSKGLNSILDMMTPYTIRFSQENAGFKVKTTENVLEVDMKPYTYDMTKRLQKDLVSKPEYIRDLRVNLQSNA